MITPNNLRQQINADLNRFSDEQEALRQQRRSELIITAFYDDDSDEPDMPIRDMLTDIMHECSRRGVDFEQALVDASRRWTSEREEWGLDL